MGVSIAAALAEDQIEALAALSEAGTGDPVIAIYAGSVPANVDAALGGATLLVQVQLNATLFSTTTGGVGTVNTSGDPEGTVLTDGTASFWRLLDEPSGSAIVQGDAADDSSASMDLNTTSFTEDSTVALTSGTITQPTEAA